MRAMLDRVLKLTGRDLAMAHTSIAVASAIAAIAPKPPQKEKFNRLTITFNDGAVYWAEGNGDDTPQSVSYWRNFLRWFHGKPDSPHYVQVVEGGARMIRRVDIRTYDIAFGERERKQ